MVNTVNPALRSTPKSSAGQGQTSDVASDSLYKSRGGAQSLDVYAKGGNGKYNVTQHMYPDDLMSPTGEYGKNFAMFYINVTEDSRIGREGKKTEFVDDIPPRDRGENIAKVERDGGGEALAAAGVGTNLVAGGVLLGGDWKKKALTGAVAVGGAAAVADQTGNFTAQTKRLKTAIALHMPNNMTIRYGVNYDEKDTLKESLIGTALAGSISLGKAAKDQGVDVMVEQAKAGFESVKSGVAAAALSVPGAELAQKLSGLAPNPRREQLFRNVDFRTFQIDYQFFPRDDKEAQNVKNIIKQFKLHMHPEYKDDNAFLYIYPSEFDIEYYHGTDENLNVHRHTSCVLTEMSINYTPQGRFNAFKDGTPSQMNVVLTFRELVPLTKERIEDGL